MVSVVTPTWFRSLGGAAQIVGILLVVLEIRRVRRRYPNATPSALRRIFQRRSKDTNVTLSNTVGTSATVGTRVVPSWDDDAPVDNKLQNLLRRTELTQIEIDEIHKRVDEEAKARSEQDAAHAATLSAQVSRLGAELEDAQTGHIRLRGWGVFVLDVVVAFATWAQEFAGWTGWKPPIPHF